jgi:hypothetical protein
MILFRPIVVVFVVICACFVAPGCATPVGDDGDGTGGSDACTLSANSQGCAECADGNTTCRYGETSVTAVSCGGCQARSRLYQALCDAGVSDSADAIEAGTSCVDEPL